MKPGLQAQSQSVLFHDLALRRVKEPLAPIRKIRRWPLALLASIFGGVELVRQVAPGRPAQPRHEWEPQDRFRPLIY